MPVCAWPITSRPCEQRAGSPAPGSGWATRSRRRAARRAAARRGRDRRRSSWQQMQLRRAGRAGACRSCGARAGHRAPAARLGQRIGLALDRPQLARARRARTGPPAARRPSPGCARQWNSQKPTTALASGASARRWRPRWARARRSRRRRSARTGASARRTRRRRAPPAISNTTSTALAAVGLAQRSARSSRVEVDRGVGAELERQRALLLARGGRDHAAGAEAAGRAGRPASRRRRRRRARRRSRPRRSRAEVR